MRIFAWHIVGVVWVSLILACCFGTRARADAISEVSDGISDVVGDPFASREKAAKLVAPSLKPDTCVGAPNTRRKLTFNDIVIATLCHNPQTRAAYMSLVGQAASYVSNYSGYLPTASASYSHTRETAFGPGTKSTSISSASGMNLAMILYDFGQREFKLDIAELSLAAAGHSYNSTLQGAIASALRGYFSLLTAQNAVEVAKESERYAKASYDAALLRHKIGQVPLADELQANVAYSQALLATEQAENGLALQQASVALLMGMGADTPIEVADIDEHALTKDPFAAELKALIAEAKDKREDLRASRASLKGAEEALEAQKRGNLATLSVTTNLGVTNDTVHLFNRNASRSQAIGFSVNIPIFTGFSSTYSERAAEESLDAQRESLTGMELSVEQDVWNSWQTYRTAKLSWSTSQEGLKSATHLKDVALGRYKEGLGTILDVLNAETQYNSALQSVLQSRYNLLTSRVDLVRAVGSLNLDTMQPENVVEISERSEHEEKP